jgi:hypothetical protein
MHVGIGSAGGGAVVARRASIAASGLYGAGNLVPRKSGRRAGEGAGAAGRNRATILDATRRKNVGRVASGVLVTAGEDEGVVTVEIMVIKIEWGRTRE